jgi:tetratricopeptide (TPR) repeat protein
LTDHPTLVELQQFCHGDLDASRVRTIVRHLLRGCQRCSSLMMPEVKAIFGLPRIEEEIPAGAYDAVFDRVFPDIEPHAHQTAEAMEETPAATPLPFVPGNGSPAGPPGFEELLDRCQTLRFDDPARMVELARFAAFFADRLDTRQYGAKRVADLRCRGWTELANAYRVADRLHEAEEALEIAAECHVEGTTDELLGARLLEIQASLDSDRRRFPEALKALDEVYAVHLRRGDRHLAGRALLKKGLYTGYDCDPEQSIRLLEEGLTLIDADRDPELVRGAVQNLSRALMDCGRLEEAQVLLGRIRSNDAGGRVGRLRVAWLEAQIEVGFGNFDQAEESLGQVLRAFEDLGLRYKAAMVGLELAAVHLRQGRADEARERAQQAIEVFSRLGVGRETLAALLVLRDAFERRIVSVALLEGVITRLSQQEREPAV